MATILLSAAGAAIGAGVGGSVLGVPSLVAGRAAGAVLGRALDQQLLGEGSEAVETGRIDRFRLSGAGEGAGIARVYGRMRLAGQVIWASDFLESRSRSGGGKGTPRTPQVTRYAYSVSLAVGLCEGPIGRVGRIWADGEEIDAGLLNMRVYPGDEVQLPDPKIAAVEGAAPAFRGLAYVVIEDLALERFGNRVPQFSFEVIRPARAPGETATVTMEEGTRAVAMMPGTGDYALATTAVYGEDGLGGSRAFNVNAVDGATDFEHSLRQLGEELPSCRSVSLVVSWFGSDLRAGRCAIRPKVEQKDLEGAQMPWTVSGVDRQGAELLARQEGAPVYGSTPSDQSVIEAIRAIKAEGMEVMFYPFLLMEIAPENGLPDPWSDAAEQPVFPWRGRITLDRAPGRSGSADGTEAAATEVAGFFGGARPGDFQPGSDRVGYAGPQEWSYRRFILHYAHLCAAAGGVAAFCIGSEMRSLTQIRGAADSFPAVAEFIALAAEVRAVLGPQTKLTYAADWSEYFGYHPADGSGDIHFHLDPLWSDTNIDAVGIDNYMPLSDWREGREHADAAAGWAHVHQPEYLRANIEGGEGYDWFYPTEAARELQLRAPIEDGAHGEHWIYRYKDLRSWWSLPHHERKAGQRQAEPTGWVPRSKPIWFTEIGCAAVDKGTNEPNKFLDPKSSESALPRYSAGQRDDLIQRRYLEAIYTYWAEPGRNPVSEIYGGPMLDMGRAHVWAWDARPYPAFPARRGLWRDGRNYDRGHWISGRTSVQDLARVVAEICGRSGLADVDTTALRGAVRGYAEEGGGPARAALQPLMLAYGFDAAERNGRLHFLTRDGRAAQRIAAGALAATRELPMGWRAERLPDPETAGRVRLSYIEAEGSFAPRVAEAALSDDPSLAVAGTELALSLTPAEARRIAQRWLAESRVARDRIRLALPPSATKPRAAEVFSLSGAGVTGDFRVDRAETGGARLVEAVRVEPGIYLPAPYEEETPREAAFVPAGPVLPLFLDLPLLGDGQVPHAPFVAAAARPWPGSVAVYASDEEAGYVLNTLIEQPASIGRTETALGRAQPGLWERGAGLRLHLPGPATLSSAGASAVLGGANALALGRGSTGPWEILQFREAVLVAPEIYLISGLLRGQLGTEAVVPDEWPAGSYAVPLDQDLRQIALPSSARDRVRHYRTGPGSRPPDDGLYVHADLAFAGVGLRPYSVAHLRARRSGEDLDLSWIRRTRIDGDAWGEGEVPLGEEREVYRLRVSAAGRLLREVEPMLPRWTYSRAMQLADGASGPLHIAVAQISDRFGAGPYREVIVNV